MRVAGGHDLFRVTTILKEQMANYVLRVLSCISTLHTLMWRAYVLFSLATCTCLAGGGGWFWNERLMWAHVLSLPFSPSTVDVRVASGPYWGYHIIIKKTNRKTNRRNVGPWWLLCQVWAQAYLLGLLCERGIFCWCCCQRDTLEPAVIPKHAHI